jgi:hypothetical protein
MISQRDGAAVLAAVLCLCLVGCGGDDSDDGAVQSTADARRAYLGLDASVDKAIQLGFDGFNAASSANIAPQTANGDESGTLTVSGQVDQGASSNKTMHLTEELDGYSDDGKLVYATNSAALPSIELKLSKVPDGTLDGTLDGSFGIDGELEGSVTLALQITAELETDPLDETRVQRQVGTTHVTGTATSGGDNFTVDVTR